MIDREKVIKALELCTSKIETRTQIPCKTCPYHNEKYHGVHGDGCCNALSLKRDVLALLKAQEPMEPIENAGFYYCGACRYAFTNARQKYCSECGRAVKWK